MQRLWLSRSLQTLRSSQERLEELQERVRAQEERTRALALSGLAHAELARELLRTLQSCADVATRRVQEHERLLEAITTERIRTTAPLVCVVDDEDSVARSMARLLRADGFRVHAFPDGSAFLDGMLQWRPDCVLLDVHMPGMSGLDVLRALSQRTEVPPVITCSGDDAPDLPARARALGSLAHLRKPLDEFALLRAIHAAIDASTGPEPPQRPTVSP